MTHILMTLLFLTLIGGLIGWVTNILAIKLLFRPIKPIKIPILNIEIIGLIPKRQKEIAKNIGEVIANELLTVDDLFSEIIKEDDKEDFNEYIKNKIVTIITEKINFIPAPFNMMIKNYIDEMINNELNPIINDIYNTIIIKSKEKIDIQKIVEEKINLLDLNKLESIIISVAKKELKHIEILGFILGGLIGIIQSLIILFIK
ncbi:DUF445 family protein [Clostridium botulinum]|uniref:DUF445 family protein n=1 Tax=Clostridium botulinum TaxID=1491 RepID=A0A6B4RSW2_CLOBO|nr:MULTISPECIES: DUF445 family protein [Clostridium]ACD51868.1 conserved hypothetical protein [Clostridium botulinum E3 str. Alaska E43]AJF29011.1 membrane protein [Clostridium botulinum]AJF32072.1 membrane protein [Clostridium botulinum]KIL09205.1 membrane protein [Clostridium botulinum]MBN1041362.1 DUF445 family protein [Clostridium botulinum]